MSDRTRAISRATCSFAILAVIGTTAASAGEDDSPVLVRMLVRDTRSVKPEAGVLVADRPGELVVLDLKTGRERTFPKSRIRSLINPATEQDVAVVTGIAPLVAWFVSESLPSRPKSGQIASVDGAVAYINRGSNVGIKEGERFDVFRGDGNEIVDPETGEVLGTTQRRIAQVEVVELREKLSKVRVKGDLEVELAVRDVVRPVAAEQAVAVLPLGRDSGQLIQGGVQLAEQIMSGLTKNEVTVVERSLLEKVLEEQSLAGTGKFDADTVQRVGKLLQAQAIVTGTIQVNGKDANVNVRLIDVETGKVLFATSLTMRGLSGALLKPFGHTRADSSQQPNKSARQTGPDTVENSIGMKLVLIPAGEFLMGSPETAEELFAEFPGADRARLDGERPVHRVRLSRAFYMGRYEVTIREFREFVEASDYRTDAERAGTGGGWDDRKSEHRWGKPGFHWRHTGFKQNDDHPVVNVSWNDAVAFCGWLGRAEGVVYRLPTEAEWEYACRAGTTTRYYYGDDPERLTQVGNVADSAYGAKVGRHNTLRSSDGWVFTCPVGSFPANGFGLCDMHGNVGEWTADWFDKTYYAIVPLTNPLGPLTGTNRVIRAGGWLDYSAYCRSARRIAALPTYRDHNIGLRVVREQ